MRKIFITLFAVIFCSSSLFAEFEAEMKCDKQEIQDLLPPYCTLNFDLSKKSNTSLENAFFSFQLDDQPEALNEKQSQKLKELLGENNSFLKLNGCSSFLPASYSHWHQYKANFGFEKIYLRFPYAPTITQGSSLIVAYAYDYNILYSFTGYFPPVGSIDPVGFFNTALFNASQPPFILLNYAIYQVDCFAVLDYVMHDTFKDMIVKSRTVVTPFNAYTLQAVCPYGYSTRFDYFIDSFKIKSVP